MYTHMETYVHTKGVDTHTKDRKRTQYPHKTPETLTRRRGLYTLETHSHRRGLYTVETCTHSEM